MANWNAAARAVWATQQIEALVALGDDRSDAAAVVARLLAEIPPDQDPATWFPDDHTLEQWAAITPKAIHDARVDWLADEAVPVRYKLLLEAGHYQASLSEGGEGSGHAGHVGVIGQLGGSAPGTGGGDKGQAKRDANRARVAAFRAKKKAEKEPKTGVLDLKAAAQKRMSVPTMKGKDQKATAKALLRDTSAEPGNIALSRAATIKMWVATHPKLENAWYSADTAARDANDYDAVAQLKALEASGKGTIEQVAAIWEHSQYAADNPENEASFHRIRVDDMIRMSTGARGALKNDVCDAVAEVANKDLPLAPKVDPVMGGDVPGQMTKEDQPGALRSSVVNEVIHSWARSSGDTDSQSIASQQAATRLFGVDPGFYVEGGAQDQAAGVTEKEREWSGRVVGAMYEHTQKVLSDAGVKTLRVYRGVKVAKAGAPGIENIKSGDTFTHKSNPMSSWSLSPTTARGFSITSNKSEKGILLCMDVPVERIVGTCISGFGCYAEQEVVVVGGIEETALVVGV